MKSTSDALGKVIANAREKLCISQEKLAERAGVHRTYVSQLERGLKSPMLDVLAKIALGLDIKLSRFMQLLEDELG